MTILPIAARNPDRKKTKEYHAARRNVQKTG